MRGRGSALRSQKTSWSPFESRLVSEVDVGGGAALVVLVLGMVEGFGGWRFGFAAFLGGGKLRARPC
jgi:hypothetical protein